MEGNTPQQPSPPGQQPEVPNPRSFQGPPMPKIPPRRASGEAQSVAPQPSDAAGKSTIIVQGDQPVDPAAITAVSAQGTSAISGPQQVDQQERQPKEGSQMRIHTMKEDMSEAKKFYKEQKRLQKVQEQEGRAPQQSEQQEQPSQVVRAPQLPLPARKDAPREEEVKRAPTRVHGSKIALITRIVVAVLILGGLGAGAWWYWSTYVQRTGDGEDASLAAAKVVSDAIPRDALLVVRYDTKQSSDLAALRMLWDNNLTLASSMDTLLAGDPRMLLEAGVTEFYYVVLSDDPRPYLVTPRVPFTEQIFSQQSSAQLLSGGSVQVLDKGEWFVVHPISTEPYSQALRNGTFSSIGGIVAPPQPTSMQWIVSPSFITLLTGDVRKVEAALNITDFITFALSFDATGKTVAFTQGPSAQGGTLGPSDMMQRLAPYIPDDVSFVRIASNFARDVEVWRQGELTLDRDIISQQEVSEFISQLDTPYAYFSRTGPDGIEDIGFVIALPEHLRRSLQVGNSVIEYALFSLLPLITDKPYDIGAATYLNNTYNSVPLRYINFLEYTQTVDYTVTDDYLFISSSKEGMYRIVDTILQRSGSVHNTSPWQNILQQSEGLFPSGAFVLGFISQPSFLELLPVHEVAQLVPVGIALDNVPGGDVLMRGLVFVGNGGVDAEDL